MKYQMKKLEFFRHILVFEFNRGARAAAAAIRTVYGDNVMGERARQADGFLVLRRIVLTLVTLHVQEDIRGLMKIV